MPVSSETKHRLRRHDGWNVKHYYAWYRRDGGQRSYSWVKNTLQVAGVVKKAAKRGAHRKRRAQRLQGRYKFTVWTIRPEAAQMNRV